MSLFFGVRLVSSIIESEALLHYTIVNTALQIVGACITVTAVTFFMAYQWWQSRKAMAAAATAAEVATDTMAAGDEEVAVPVRM